MAKYSPGAEQEAGPGRTYLVYVALVPEDGHSDLLRLYGNDPTVVPFDDDKLFRYAFHVGGSRREV